MADRTCIYCRRGGSEVRFSRDHVVPVQLGSFQNNPTLGGMVCEDCNRYCGDHLELFLGCDSYEGLMRLQRGVTPAPQARRFLHRRVELRLPEGSAWEGARLFLRANADGSDVVPDLPPQIGVQPALAPRFRYFLEGEFAGATDKELGLGRRCKFALHSNDAASHARLVALVTTRVPEFRIDGPMPPPPLEDGQLVVEIVATLDAVLTRALAKIAFNYLAHVTSAEFLLREEFDPVRRFIRFGESECRQFVGIRQRPILGNESRRYKITDGHLVAVEWAERTTAIRGLVSPFNTVTYEVSLCANFRGVWRSIERGNLFDWQSGAITELWSPRCRSSPLIVPALYPLLPP